MGLLEKLWEFLQGKTSSGADRIENPERALDLAIEGMSSELADFRSKVAAALVDQKKLLGAFEKAAAQSDEWERRAEAAVKAGDDELAREALRRQSEETAVARSGYEALEHQNEVVAQLKDALRDLNHKLDEAKRRRNLLVARARGAVTKKKLAETLGGADPGGAFDRFDKLEERVEHLEAEASVAVDMMHEFKPVRDRDFEKRFRALKTTDPTLDEALRRLKTKIGARDGKPAALGPASPTDKKG